VIAFAADYSNMSIMYAGASEMPWWGPYSQSGVFKTTDGGKVWYRVNRGLGNPSVGALWLNQSDPDIVLAATPAGIYRSADAGTSWTRVYNVSAYAFSSSEDTVYAATGQGVAASTDSGISWKIIEATPSTVTAVAAGNGGALYVGTLSGAVM